MNNKNRKKGFTLIELIVVLAILGIVITMTFNLINYGTRSFNKSEDQFSAQNIARIAAINITDSIRTSSAVEILDALPAVYDTCNYIYVDGTAIKYRNEDGSVIRTIGSIDGISGSIALNFNVDSSKKVLAFTISIVSDGQSFETTSKIKPENLASSTTIEIDNSLLTSGGSVLCFSNPNLTDESIVNLDQLELDIKKTNPYLDFDAVDTYTLNEPHISPNYLNLVDGGFYGSTISWSAGGSAYVVASGAQKGFVYRPGLLDSDELVVLTATLSKGAVTVTKDFKILIKKLASISLLTPSNYTYDASTGIDEIIKATGGNPGYSYTSSNLPAGLTLSSDGALFGFIDSGVTLPVSFTITITDSQLTTSGVLVPNTRTETITIIN